MDSPLPPTPSPPPRLRRSPTRRALHERTKSHTNEVTLPTIRPVTDADAKVYATRPFPTSARQVLAPRGPREYPFASFAPGAGTSTAGGGVNNNHNNGDGRGGRLGGSTNPVVSQSNATPLFATPRVQNPRDSVPRAINAKHARGPAQFSHDGPGLEPSAAHTDYPPSSPPEEATEKSHYSPSSGIDVDRLVMDRGPNPNDYHERPSLHLMPVAPATQPRRNGQFQPSSLPSFVTPYPSSSSSSRESRANLGAIASVASGLSYDSQDTTPMSVGSAGSSGTVIRKRGFTGPTPPGFYTLFPPTPAPQSGLTRYSRSSSAPPRPNSTDLSSPVSPLSPEDDPEDVDYPPRPDPTHGHSSPETALGDTPESIDYKGHQGTQFTSIAPLSPTRIAQQDQPLPHSPSFQIPRKPVVGRSNAVRWTSYMSTIPSESADERSSAGEAVSRIHSGATASSSLGAGLSGQGHPSLKTIGNLRLSRDFPLPEPLFSGKRTSRQRVMSGGSTIRVVSGQDGDIRAAPNDRVASMSSLYSHPDYRDSGSQTEAGLQRSSRGSLFRESIPAWARFYYSNEARNRHTIGQRDSVPIRSDSRRHTVDSQYPYQDSLRIARNRPTGQGATGGSYRDSMPITPLTPLDPNSIFVGEVIRGDPKVHSGTNWSPHLWHNRGAAIKRRTMFQAPSIDEEAEGRGLSRRNAQIWLFALGFVFPLGWILAAILPLPPMPRTPPASPAFEHDLEKTLGPIDQARYENARWWRNVNRIMSVVGVGVIVAIIVLAVVASKTSS